MAGVTVGCDLCTSNYYTKDLFFLFTGKCSDTNKSLVFVTRNALNVINFQCCWIARTYVRTHAMYAEIHTYIRTYVPYTILGIVMTGRAAGFRVTSPYFFEL